MLDTFKYEKRDKYPHMSVADTAIWNRYIEKFPTAYDSCEYDFHVGEPPKFNTLYDDGSDKNQDKLYRLRIDVVAHKDGKTCIIEIKPSAGPSSIGQLNTYARFYEEDINNGVAVDEKILTDIEMPSMDRACKIAGVDLVVI